MGEPSSTAADAEGEAQETAIGRPSEMEVVNVTLPMCDVVEFTDFAARCVGGYCGMRPRGVTCTWRRTSGWECAAQMSDGYELNSAQVSCRDTSRCEGSTCTVEYMITKTFYQSVHDGGATFFWI